jgi:FkbM family methyltransferase
MGTSIGVVASWLARTIRPESPLICVEANPTLLATIRTNLKLNVPNRQFTLLNRAVAYDNHSSIFFRPGSDTLSGYVTDVPPGIPIEKITLTKVLSLAGLLDQDYVLVCDIEGSEAGLIVEEHPALLKCRQLLIELHPGTYQDRRYSVAALRDTLINARGFEVEVCYGNVFLFTRPN